MQRRWIRRFISQFGAPAEDHVLLLPLHLKDKVAALVYADAGTGAGGKMDAAALELLVSATSAWLEVASLRKQALKEGRGRGRAPAKSSKRPRCKRCRLFQILLRPMRRSTWWRRRSRSRNRRWQRATAEVVSAPASMAAAAVAPATDAFAHMSPEDAERPSQGATFCPAADG